MDEVNFARILNQQAEMFALCADMEGMKARNTERLANNEPLAYSEPDFNYLAASLRNVANDLYQLGYR
jgi:hypothetical protein